MKIKLGILKAFAHEHEYYLKACNYLKLDHEVIDLLAPDWIERIKNSDCDGFVCHPPNDIQETKSIYDEKIYIINKLMQKPIYPSYESLLIYENKRNLINWLQAKEIPHPESRIFCRRKDAKSFFKSAEFPLFFKTSIGSASTGVDVIKTRRKANWIADQVFGRIHPAMALGRLKFGGRLALPMPLFGRIQRHYLIVQKFYRIKWEWRIFFIGDFASGFKKVLKGNFASGSMRKEWKAPPRHVFDFAREVYDSKDWFDSMSIDILETKDGTLLVNELQAHFGNPGREYPLEYKGKIGAFRYDKGEYAFEEGLFDQDMLNQMRLEDFLNRLKKNK